MNPAELVEFSLRATELALSMNEHTIARAMLNTAALALLKETPATPSQSVVITTDYERGCPCS